MEQSWGGSELLWSETALWIAKVGRDIAVSIDFRRDEPGIIREIEKAGGKIFRRNQPAPLPPPASLPKRAFRRVKRMLLEKDYQPHTRETTLRVFEPDLVVISQAQCLDGTDWMNLCQVTETPYVTISNGCHIGLLCDDVVGDEVELPIRGAIRNFFVSRENQRMVENFLCAPLEAAEIVRTPFGVPWDVTLPWPNEDVFRIAVVARFHTSSKGQDLLFHALNQDKWRKRNLEVCLYGSGGRSEKRQKRLAEMLDIPVRYPDYVADIVDVWRVNHLLCLPSRSEGLPIALIEALLCGRPAVVTDVGDSASVIVPGTTGFVAAAPTVELIDHALEQAWQERHRWEKMGKAAREHIRTLIPENPAKVFGERLLELAQSEVARAASPSDPGESLVDSAS